MAKIKLQWPFIIGVLVVLIVVSFAGIWYSEQTSFCVSCHEMKLYGDTFAKSSHGPAAIAKAEKQIKDAKAKGEKVYSEAKSTEVGCHSCHSWPGAGGFVKTKIVGMVELWKHITVNYKTPIKGEPVEERCTGCHDVSKLNETKTHKIPHKKHADMGLKCMDCHGGLIHGVNGGGEVKVSHANCQKCHDTNDQNACTKCHKW